MLIWKVNMKRGTLHELGDAPWGADLWKLGDAVSHPVLNITIPCSIPFKIYLFIINVVLLDKGNFRTKRLSCLLHLKTNSCVSSQISMCQLQLEPSCLSVSPTWKRDAFIKSYNTVSMTL